MCFVVGWNTFDEENEVYDLNIQFMDGFFIPSTATIGSSDVKYSEKYISQYMSSGFLTIMSLAAKHTAKIVYEKDVEFSLLYTSLSIDSYKSADAIIVMSIIPIFIFALIQTPQAYF
jgi:hypothetical protein